VPGVSPAPAAVRICEIYLDAVHGLGLILFLCLEDELLKDGIVAGHDAREGAPDHAVCQRDDV